MDETNKATQDSLQGTGQASGGKEGTTSENQPKTYTEEEVTKRISDELAKAGRDAKSLEVKAVSLKAQEDALKSRSAELDDWIKAREAEELEAAKGDPAKLISFQEKQAIRAEKARIAEEKAAFEEAKAKHEADLQSARDVTREITIWKIAGDNLDPDKLKDACDKLNAQTEEQIKIIADTLRPEKKSDDKTQEGKKAPFKADSSVTTGVVPGDKPMDRVTRGLEKLRKQQGG